MAIGTDKLIEGMRRLRMYESRALVGSEYKHIHQRTASATKISSVVMSIKQGRELFESAANTDYMTKPIELYYGMVSFIRSMTLMSSNLAEGSIKQSHGLKIISFPTAITSAQDILDMQIEFEGGGFTQWYQEAQQSFPLRVRSSEPDWDFAYEGELIGKVVTFGQILSLIPDVWKELSLVDGINRTRFLVENFQDNTISFNGRATQQQAEECFPGIETNKVTHLNNINWSADFRTMTGFLPQVTQQNEDGFNIGNTLIVPPLGTVRLSPLAAYVVSAYVISMLARYRPSIWGSLWNGGAGNEMYPLFSQLMITMQGWFPYMYAENMKKLASK